MKEDLIKEIIACLPKGKMPFYYFRDRYALMMLSYYVGDGKMVHEIKKSRYGKLLNKPVVKNVTKDAGGGILTDGALESVWPPMPECYLLTLGKWGERVKWSRWYNQTSRSGSNLVLQLNFSHKHNQPYRRILVSENEHPIAQNGFHTLAWARIDLDFDTDEALIEEIQSDWIKMAIGRKAAVERIEQDEQGALRYVRRYVEHLGCDPDALKKYVDEILKPHMKIWDEAMLAAAIWFMKEEIGIKDIYYHTFDFGCRLKGISHRQPPRSLYTTLPDKFCFEETRDFPQFLGRKNNRRIRALLKSKDARFFHLSV